MLVFKCVLPAHPFPLSHSNIRVSVLRRLGDALYNLSSFVAATSSFIQSAKFVQSGTIMLDVYVKLALALWEGGDKPTALGLVKSVLDKDDNHIGALLAYAKFLEDNEQARSPRYCVLPSEHLPTM